MIRALAGLFLSQLGLWCAELATRLLRPPVDDSHPSRRAESPCEPRGCRAVESSAPPPVATLVAERYVRDLVHVELVRADALLGFVLSRGPVFFNGSTFAKIADVTWRH